MPLHASPPLHPNRVHGRWCFLGLLDRQFPSSKQPGNPQNDGEFLATCLTHLGKLQNMADMKLTSRSQTWGIRQHMMRLYRAVYKNCS